MDQDLVQVYLGDGPISAIWNTHNSTKGMQWAIESSVIRNDDVTSRIKKDEDRVKLLQGVVDTYLISAGEKSRLLSSMLSSSDISSEMIRRSVSTAIQELHKFAETIQRRRKLLPIATQPKEILDMTNFSKIIEIKRVAEKDETTADQKLKEISEIIKGDADYINGLIKKYGAMSFMEKAAIGKEHISNKLNDVKQVVTEVNTVGVQQYTKRTVGQWTASMLKSFADTIMMKTQDKPLGQTKQLTEADIKTKVEEAHEIIDKTCILIARAVFDHRLKEADTILNTKIRDSTEEARLKAMGEMQISIELRQTYIKQLSESVETVTSLCRQLSRQFEAKDYKESAALISKMTKALGITETVVQEARDDNEIKQYSNEINSLQERKQKREKKEEEEKKEEGQEEEPEEKVFEGDIDIQLVNLVTSFINDQSRSKVVRPTPSDMCLLSLLYGSNTSSMFAEYESLNTKKKHHWYRKYASVITGLIKPLTETSLDEIDDVLETICDINMFEGNKKETFKTVEKMLGAADQIITRDSMYFDTLYGSNEYYVLTLYLMMTAIKQTQYYQKGAEFPNVKKTVDIITELIRIQGNLVTLKIAFVIPLFKRGNITTIIKCKRIESSVKVKLIQQIFRMYSIYCKCAYYIYVACDAFMREPTSIYAIYHDANLHNLNKNLAEAFNADHLQTFFYTVKWNRIISVPLERAIDLYSSQHGDIFNKGNALINKVSTKKPESTGLYTSLINILFEKGEYNPNDYETISYEKDSSKESYKIAGEDQEEPDTEGIIEKEEEEEEEFSIDKDVVTSAVIKREEKYQPSLYVEKVDVSIIEDLPSHLVITLCQLTPESMIIRRYREHIRETDDVMELRSPKSVGVKRLWITDSDMDKIFRESLRSERALVVNHEIWGFASKTLVIPRKPDIGFIFTSVSRKAQLFIEYVMGMNYIRMRSKIDRMVFILSATVESKQEDIVNSYIHCSLDLYIFSIGCMVLSLITGDGNDAELTLNSVFNLLDAFIYLSLYAFLLKDRNVGDSEDLDIIPADFLSIVRNCIKECFNPYLITEYRSRIGASLAKFNPDDERFKEFQNTLAVFEVMNRVKRSPTFRRLYEGDWVSHSDLSDIIGASITSTSADNIKSNGSDLYIEIESIGIDVAREGYLRDIMKSRTETPIVLAQIRNILEDMERERTDSYLNTSRGRRDGSGYRSTKERTNSVDPRKEDEALRSKFKTLDVKSDRVKARHTGVIYKEGVIREQDLPSPRDSIDTIIWKYDDYNVLWVSKTTDDGYLVYARIEKNDYLLKQLFVHPSIDELEKQIDAFNELKVAMERQYYVTKRGSFDELDISLFEPAIIFYRGSYEIWFIDEEGGITSETTSVFPSNYDIDHRYKQTVSSLEKLSSDKDQVIMTVMYNHDIKCVTDEKSIFVVYYNDYINNKQATLTSDDVVTGDELRTLSLSIEVEKRAMLERISSSLG